MRIIYAENSHPTKPWVRRWMIWAVGFVAVFLPRLLMGLLAAPYGVARNEWEDLRVEVMSFKCDSEEG